MTISLISNRKQVAKTVTIAKDDRLAALSGVLVIFWREWAALIFEPNFLKMSLGAG